MHAARCGDIDLGSALTRTRQKCRAFRRARSCKCPSGEGTSTPWEAGRWKRAPTPPSCSRRGGNPRSTSARRLPRRPAHSSLRARGRACRSRPGTGTGEPGRARGAAGGRSAEHPRRHSTTLVDATKPTTGNAPCPAKHLEARLCSSGPRNAPTIRDARACNPAHPHCRRVGRCQPRESDHPWPSVCSGRRWRSLPRVRVPESSRPDADAVRVRPAARVGAAEPSRVQAGRFGGTARARCRIRSSRAGSLSAIETPTASYRRQRFGAARAGHEVTGRDSAETKPPTSAGSMSANPPSTGHAGTPGRMNLGT